MVSITSIIRNDLIKIQRKEVKILDELIGYEFTIRCKVCDTNVLEYFESTSIYRRHLYRYKSCEHLDVQPWTREYAAEHKDEFIEQFRKSVFIEEIEDDVVYLIIPKITCLC